MASQFSVEVSVREAPSEAQAHAAEAFNEPARAIGLRLTQRQAGGLQYRPRVQFPFLIMLWHTVNGERMNVRFEPRDGGGTRLRISGAVARDKQPLAADPEHWTEALGSSALTDAASG